MRGNPQSATSVVLKAKRFSHEDAHAISKWVLGRDRSRSVVVVDLSQADDATTAAFATLVVLRRRLLKHGRDLRVVGLRDGAHGCMRFHASNRCCRDTSRIWPTTIPAGDGCLTSLRGVAPPERMELRLPA